MSALLLLAVWQAAQTEADAYVVERYETPAGAVLEIGGMDFLSNGDLVVSTRRGQVWIVEDAQAEDVADARFRLFAEGLWEGLGLTVVDDVIHVVQRGELSRLLDTDGDGTCDTVETICDDWGLSGHYHEFAFGLPRDDEGNWYVGLNVSFGDPEWWHGRSTVPDRGWIVRVSPEGEMTPWAMGFRSPCGVARDSRGRIFVTDNQGDWCPSSPIYLLREGGFYGHPKSLNWTSEYLEKGLRASDEIPPARAATGREPAVVWIPYEWSRSTGNLLELRDDDAFGPFGGQYVVAELTNGMLLRADFEEVQGVLQGWVAPLRRDVGSVVRVLQGPDGHVYCGLTNRGWGGKAPADGLARVRYTGADVMDLARVRLVDAEDEYDYGFEVRFTEPVAADWEPTPDAVELVQYDYDYWWEYGSPQRHVTELAVASIELSDDRRTLVLRSEELLPAYVARVTLEGVASEGGAPLLHPEFAYTVNQLPSGPRTTAHVAKIVPPPPTKNAASEGVLHLSWGDALGQFDAPAWRLVSATLDSDDPTRFRVGEGNGALINDADAERRDLVSRGAFGDAHVHVEFMLPEGGDSGVFLMGRYEVQLRDTADAAEPTAEDCGGVYPGDGFDGAAPATNAYRGPGEWHELDVWFRAPRFDADGTKVEDARFDRVLIDDVLVHEGVGVPGPTYGAPLAGEAARGPLVVQGVHVPVAIRNVQVKPLDRPPLEDGWTLCDLRAEWDAWEASGDTEWELDGEELVGKGPRGHLWRPGGALSDFDVRCRAKVNANGAGALVLRAREDEDGAVRGYAVRLNSSHPDGGLSGSIAGLAPIGTELVAADTWVDVQASVWTTEAGTRVRVFLNGVLVNDLLDEESRHGPGELAIECHHDGTVMRVRDLAVRER